ncbi:MAG: [Fe-S]-binding protein [Chloroflexia bacterium]|nr:[Fe-S]-binding protein [Chloroflexia bacterium]
MGLDVFERGTLPRWAPVRQHLVATRIPDIATAVSAQLARPEIAAAIHPGQRIALTAGSRGIDRIADVLKATADGLKALGAEPFIVPAMGSHAGAVAESQTELIAHYGVTEAAMGCPILSSMETVHLGDVEDGVPVWFDAHAYRADATIPIGRVKPHTDFRGPVESGLMKMVAIGLGKQKGAEFFHAQGFFEFHHLIPAVAQFTLARVNIPFGIAVVENGFGELGLVEAVPAATMWEREQALLRIAREWLGRLPGERIDVLVVDMLGKDISGAGMDPNVINRDSVGAIPMGELAPKPHVARIIVRGLTEDTEGNASGIGLADVVLRRAADEIDPVRTYMNMITAKTPQAARVPLTVDTDREALFVAIACCLKTTTEGARIARIRDTKHVELLWVSEPLLPDLLASGRVEQIGALEPMPIDASGMLPDW